MKNLVTILSHCNTTAKLNVLLKNIAILKSISANLDILVVSHVSIPSSIQEEVDYVIFDKSNPIMFFPERGSIAWWNIGAGSGEEYAIENKNGTPVALRLESIVPDYGWAALNQITLAAHIGLSLDYDYYTFINYDLKITQEVINHIASPPGVTLSTNLKSEDDLSRLSLLLNILDKTTLRTLLSLFSREKYTSRVHGHPDRLAYNGIEAYWDYLVRSEEAKSFREYTVIPTPLDDEIDLEEGLHYTDNFNQNHKNDLFKIFVDNSEDPKAYVYDIKDAPAPHPNKTIKLKINNQIKSITHPQVIALPDPLEKLGYFDPECPNEFIDLTPRVVLPSGFHRIIKISPSA
tara:strand:- start:8 stop:1051 length:1044 start_codon:yes stop_codon:yes gene_type:complete